MLNVLKDKIAEYQVKALTGKRQSVAVDDDGAVQFVIGQDSRVNVRSNDLRHLAFERASGIFRRGSGAKIEDTGAGLSVASHYFEKSLSSVELWIGIKPLEQFFGDHRHASS